MMTLPRPHACTLQHNMMAAASSAGMKASTFLNLTMLNDREVQSEYNAQQYHPSDNTELKLNANNYNSDFLEKI